MKRSYRIVFAVLFLITTVSGCSTDANTLPTLTPQLTQTVTFAPSYATPVKPSPTPEVVLEPSSTPDEALPEPTEIIPNTNVYTSIGLGLTFTVPKSWVGKYRVKECEGFVTVCFNPAEPIDTAHEGEFFSILKIADTNEELLRYDWDFRMNDTTYIWGSNAQFIYWQTDPEFATYAKMEKDIPDIFKTVRSISGQVPDHVKRLWIEVFPTTTEYTTTMGLGIAFTLPKSWIGKCRIVESEDDISIYFHPAEPFDPNTGDGFLFFISRKVSDVDTPILDGVHEFVVGSITYISGTSTDVPYSVDQPEYDIYMSMGGQQEILDSVRAVK